MPAKKSQSWVTGQPTSNFLISVHNLECCLDHIHYKLYFFASLTDSSKEFYLIANSFFTIIDVYLLLCLKYCSLVVPRCRWVSSLNVYFFIFFKWWRQCYDSRWRRNRGLLLRLNSFHSSLLLPPIVDNDTRVKYQEDHTFDFNNMRNITVTIEKSCLNIS